MPKYEIAYNDVEGRVQRVHIMAKNEGLALNKAIRHNGDIAASSHFWVGLVTGDQNRVLRSMQAGQDDDISRELRVWLQLITSCPVVR